MLTRQLFRGPQLPDGAARLFSLSFRGPRAVQRKYTPCVTDPSPSSSSKCWALRVCRYTRSIWSPLYKPSTLPFILQEEAGLCQESVYWRRRRVRLGLEHWNQVEWRGHLEGSLISAKALGLKKEKKKKVLSQGGSEFNISSLCISPSPQSSTMLEQNPAPPERTSVIVLVGWLK